MLPTSKQGTTRTLAFPVTIFIAASGTEEQYARVVKLHEYIYEHTEYRPLQSGLGNMLNARKQK